MPRPVLAVLLALTALLAAAGPAGAARPVVPRLDAVKDARRYVDGRAGTVAFAVVRSDGHLVAGHLSGRRFPSASVSKAMILVAYLRRAPRIAHDAQLRAMVTRSDNDAAWALYRLVGRDAALLEVARAAGMRSFGPVGYWSDAQLTAADQARFFARLDRLVPRARRAYARELLSSVVAPQSWGIPRAARPLGWKAFFKGGWRRGIVHQVAALEHDDRRFAIAVLTQGSPSFGYGTATVQGVAARLVPKP